MLLSGLSLTGNKVLYYPTQWGEGQWSHGVRGLGCKWYPCRWPRRAPQAWRSGWQEVGGGSRAPAGPLWGTGTVGRCCREPGPRPRPPRAGLTSVRGVTSSRQTLMPVVSLPARFLGLGQEPAWKPSGVREKAEACAGLADPDPASSRPDWPGLRAGRSRPRHEVTGRGHGAPLSLGLGLHAGPAACEPGGGGPRSRGRGRAVWTDRAHEETAIPAPGLTCVPAPVSWPWGVFVVGLAQPCSRADPGRPPRPGQL